MEHEFWPMHDVCKPETMTSTERLYALYKAVEYVVGHDIPGDYVECGVWRGGSVMMMIHADRHFGGSGRRIHCFDTFEGMPPPTDVDVQAATGVKAEDLLARSERTEASWMWGIASLDTVKRNVAGTGCPADRVEFIKGPVEDTIPRFAPEAISILRLDTDWYASTKHELVQLYPRLVSGGVLIIDDYGFWRGSRQAVDEYFKEVDVPTYLNRIDDTGRLAIKR